MHIQESHQNQQHTLAKCSTMTEDGHRKSGMNGIIDDGGVNVGAAIKQNVSRNDIDQRSPASTMGGRLKFFKDGKFILELARVRESERMSWVSVPRKAFWPPHATTGTTPPTHRQESSTSLSVSDDNSSIQSSPWQRDHSWKQNSPRCNVSSEMTFFYHRSKRTKVPVGYSKRRRPFDISTINVVKSQKSNDDRDECDSIVQSNNIEKESEHSNQKSKETDLTLDKNGTQSTEAISKSNRSFRKKIINIITELWDKKPQQNNLNTFKSVLLTSSRHEQMVSPRKRILRELERVTIDDLSNKRSRAKPTQSTSSFAPSTSGSSRTQNGSTEAPSTKISSSYSITSLLGHRKDEESSSPSPSIPNDYQNHNTQLSPNVSHRLIMNNMPLSPKNITYSLSPKLISHHESPDMTPSPEPYRYVPPSSLTHNSPTHALSPPPDIHKMYRVHNSPNHFSPLQGLTSHQKSPQYYTPSSRPTASPASPRSPIDDRSIEQRYAESHSRKFDAIGHHLLDSEPNLNPSYINPYMYPPGSASFLAHQSYYASNMYRHLYQVPGDALSHTSGLQPRSFLGHQPWGHFTQTHTPDILREDLNSDVPLNLSKDAV